VVVYIVALRRRKVFYICRSVGEMWTGYVALEKRKCGRRDLHWLCIAHRRRDVDWLRIPVYVA